MPIIINKNIQKEHENEEREEKKNKINRLQRINEVEIPEKENETEMLFIAFHS